MIPAARFEPSCIGRVPGPVAGLAVALLLAGDASAAAAQEPEPAEQEYIVLRGRVFTIDGRNPIGLRVFVRSPAGTDSAAVLPSGEFTLVTSAPAVDSVEVFIDAADRDARWYHPSWVRLGAAELRQELRFALVPRAWRIEAGVYGGKFVEINLVAAFAPSEDDSTRSFYRRFPVRRGWERPYVPLSWPPEAFPIPIVFVRDSAQRNVSSQDSTAFWFAVREMERHFGEKLFRPGRIEDHLQDGPVEGIITARFDRNQRVPGMGGARWRSDGTIYHGYVAFRERTGMGSVHLVIHELFHALGFGHTCYWSSVMTPNCRRTPRAPMPGSHDVGHVQVMRRVFEVQREHGARFGLCEALNGERVLVQGLEPEDLIVPIDRPEQTPGRV